MHILNSYLAVNVSVLDILAQIKEKSSCSSGHIKPWGLREAIVKEWLDIK